MSVKYTEMSLGSPSSFLKTVSTSPSSKNHSKMVHPSFQTGLTGIQREGRWILSLDDKFPSRAPFNPTQNPRSACWQGGHLGSRSEVNLKTRPTGPGSSSQREGLICGLTAAYCSVLHPFDIMTVPSIQASLSPSFCSWLSKGHKWNNIHAASFTWLSSALTWAL